VSAATLVYRGLRVGDTANRLRGGLAAYTALPSPATAGFQDQDCTSTVPPASGFSLETGSNPAVLVGDVFIVPLVSFPGGYALQVNGDGTGEILFGGDTSRQSFSYYVFRHLSNTIDGPGVVYINEAGPVWGTSLFLNNQTIGSAVPSGNLANYASSPSGDTLTFAITGGNLPPGIQFSSATNWFTGTYTAFGNFIFQITAYDSTGTGTTTQAEMIVSGVLVPSVTGDNAAVANTLISMAGLSYLDVPVYSSTYAAGYVANQSPSAGTSVAFNSVVTLGVSQGAYQASVAPPVQPILKVTMRDFSLQEMVERAWGSEYSAPDHRVYAFGGGKRYFDSTDQGNTGIYQKPGSNAGGA